MVSFSPDKLALEGIRAEARRSICAAFGVPPTVANASDQGSYATADEQRQSLTRHPFYIYVLVENGNVVGYFVGQTAPQNACNFLSETTKIGTTPYNSNVYYRQAPSLDGVYYGGTGSSGACDEWFFFDATSDALIKIRGLNFFTADQPLKLEADPIEVRTAK